MFLQCSFGRELAEIFSTFAEPSKTLSLKRSTGNTAKLPCPSHWPAGLCLYGALHDHSFPYCCVPVGVGPVPGRCCRTCRFCCRLQLGYASRQACQVACQAQEEHREEQVGRACDHAGQVSRAARKAPESGRGFCTEAPPGFICGRHSRLPVMAAIRRTPSMQPLAASIRGIHSMAPSCAAMLGCLIPSACCMPTRSLPASRQLRYDHA